MLASVPGSNACGWGLAGERRGARMSQSEGPKANRFPLPLKRLAGEVTTSGPRQLLRPQRLLRDVARDGVRSSAPTGIGLDSEWVRLRMIDRLRTERVCGERVLVAMASVPRHRFIDSALAAQAYEDTSLPIGHGQTISKPSVVARMLGLLCDGQLARRDGHLGRTLEIGSGCGYQAALLAELSTDVVSIERLGALHARALATLAQLNVKRVRLVHGDGMDGVAAFAPYHSIVAAAGGESMPPAWLAQLARGGRLVAPMHRDGSLTQVIMVVDKSLDGHLREQVYDGVMFVPLKSGTL